MTTLEPGRLPMNSPLAAFQHFQVALLASLRDPECRQAPRGVPVRRWQLYRELLYNKIESSLSACFPITRELLGQRAWMRLLKAFIAEHRCVRPCYRDIPEEFKLYLQQRRLAEGDPPCLFELAHYEWMELVLLIAETRPPAGVDPTGDLLAGRPVLNPVLSLSCYRFPVHAIRPDRNDWATWRTRTIEDDTPLTYLLGFRNADDEVRFIQTSAATTLLLDRLIDQDLTRAVTGRDILSRLAEESGHPDPERFVSCGAATLLELREQGAIAGVSPARTPSNESLQGA